MNLGVEGYVAQVAGLFLFAFLIVGTIIAVIVTGDSGAMPGRNRL